MGDGRDGPCKQNLESKGLKGVEILIMSGCRVDVLLRLPRYGLSRLNAYEETRSRTPYSVITSSAGPGGTLCSGQGALTAFA